MKKRIFLGNVRPHVFDDGTPIFNVGINQIHIQQMLDNLNEKGWINVTLAKNKNNDNFSFYVEKGEEN